MSTPITNMPDRSDEAEPELEVDELSNADGTPPVLEVDPISDASDAEETEEADEPAPVAGPTPYAASAEKSSGRMGLLALALVVLLAVSVAINLKQVRDVSTLQAQSDEFKLALDGAIERIDTEAARADAAEAKLASIGGAVDTVNDRILSLQLALDELQAATAP